MGKTYRSAAKSGTRHAIGTSVDADLVTFVSALVLFVFAIGPVHGFALTLMIGIVVRPHRWRSCSRASDRSIMLRRDGDRQSARLSSA